MSAEAIIALATFLFSGALACGVAWGISQRGQKALEDADRKTDEKLEKLDQDVWKEIGKLRDWRHAHGDESSRTRLDLEKEMGRIRETIIMKDGKLDEVLRRLETMDKKIDRLETRDERSIKQ